MKLFSIIAGLFLALGTVSAVEIGDTYDPYVVSKNIETVPPSPMMVQPQFGDTYNPYVTSRQIIAPELTKEYEPALGDTYDPYSLQR